MRFLVALILVTMLAANASACSRPSGWQSPGAIVIAPVGGGASKEVPLESVGDDAACRAVASMAFDGDRLLYWNDGSYLVWSWEDEGVEAIDLPGENIRSYGLEDQYAIVLARQAEGDPPLDVFRVDLAQGSSTKLVTPALADAWEVPLLSGARMAWAEPGSLSIYEPATATWVWDHRPWSAFGLPDMEHHLVAFGAEWLILQGTQDTWALDVSTAQSHNITGFLAGRNVIGVDGDEVYVRPGTAEGFFRIQAPGGQEESLSLPVHQSANVVIADGRVAYVVRGDAGTTTTIAGSTTSPGDPSDATTSPGATTNDGPEFTPSVSPLWLLGVLAILFARRRAWE